MNASAKKEEPAAKFPYSIPIDSEVRIETELSHMSKDTRSHNEIFCQVCTFPMNIRVHIVRRLKC